VRPGRKRPPSEIVNLPREAQQAPTAATKIIKRNIGAKENEHFQRAQKGLK
tara:strand:- start:706 stop:858 length:153 start_codon:yes stop_codon:yes gene_type:complete